MHIHIITNFDSGKGHAKNRLLEIMSILREKNHVTITPTGTIEQTISKVSELATDGCELIISAGGDGTLNACINGIMHAKNKNPSNKTVLGIIPLGVSNVFALEADIPMDPIKACRALISYQTKKTDLIKICTPFTRYFISMAGIGFDAQVVKSFKPKLKKIVGGKLAHILTGIPVLLKYNPTKFSLVCDNTQPPLSGYFAIIGNIKSYGGRFRITSHANLDDGLLHICLFKGPRRRDLLRYIWGIIIGKHLSFDDVEYLRTKAVKLQYEGNLWAQVDGDSLEIMPSEFEICPKAIDMLLP
ncbi:MAG: diacylglycerol kinase family protein [bacterium]